MGVMKHRLFHLFTACWHRCESREPVIVRIHGRHRPEGVEEVTTQQYFGAWERCCKCGGYRREPIYM